MVALHGFLLLALVMSVGCGSPTAHWTKAGVTVADFERDSYECARQATFTSRRAGGGVYREETQVNIDLYRGCLRARGYSRNDPNGWEGFRD